MNDTVDLATRLRESGPLAPNQVAYVLSVLAPELDRLATSGHPHGRISPAAIVLHSDGRVTLTPAHLLGPTTEAGAFAAPEVLAGGRPGARSEVYSLARTVHTLLTGSLPEATGYATHNRSAADMSQETRAVLDRATSQNPAVRYRTAGEFATELSAADMQNGAAARPPSNTPASSPADLPGKGPALPILALLLGITALVAPFGLPHIGPLDFVRFSRHILAVLLSFAAAATGVAALVGHRRHKWAAGIGIVVSLLSLAMWGVSFFLTQA